MATYMALRHAEKGDSQCVYPGITWSISRSARSAVTCRKGHEVRFDLAQLVAQPHAHVAGHLLVAAPACVQLAGHVLADDLA